MPLPFAALERIDRLCTRFEQDWRGGPRPDLRDYLTGDGEERRALFRELLKVELEYRRKRGEQPDATEYGTRFPEDDGAAVCEGVLGEMETPGEHRASPSTASAPIPGEAAQAPLPGGTSWRYRVERLLGQGAFGSVYLAEDLELHRFVALKVACEPWRTPGDGDAFLEEARALASLDHPAVVPVFDVGRANGRSYIVTKLIEGSNLSERLRQGLPPRRQAAEWLVAVASGLQAAHDRGLVHRDVKPSNILIDAAGRAYIGDFGLALSAAQFGQGPRLLGTPAYMSPEQARGEGHRADARSDVFSLGAVLYETVTGRPPFQADSVSKTLHQVLEHEPVAPARLNPSVGRDLDTICLKCLEKNPEKRYASAQAVADDLQRYLDSRPILARPAGPGEKLARWCRRNPLVAGSLTGALAVFVTAFVLVSWSYVRAEAAFEEEARQKREARRREEAERWERYRANMSAAASAMQMPNLGAAREALLAAPDEHRNWEWHHFHRRLDDSRHVWRGPNGTSFVEFAPGGATVALINTSHPLRLWDVTGGKEIGPLRDIGSGFHLRFSPDGKAVAYPDRERVVVRDVASDRSRLVLRGHEQGVWRVRFSADGSRLASGAGDRTARVWDMSTGKQLLVLRGHEDTVCDVAFSPDGRRLVSCGSDDRTVRLWDARSGRLVAVLGGHEATVAGAYFSPQGDRILSIEYYPGNSLRLWDAATGRLVAVLRGHTNHVPSSAFSPDGTRIASCAWDQTVRLWDGRTGAPLATLQGHRGRVLSVAFSPDGTRLASASLDQTVRLWDAASGAPLAVLVGHESEVRGAAYTADGAWVVSCSADGEVRLWDVPSAERRGVLRGHAKEVYGVAFHPDGARLATAAWDGTARIWDATTGRTVSVLTLPERPIVTSVAFHPAGRLLATLSRDDAVRLWDVETAREVHRFHVPSKFFQDSRLAFSPRGDLLAAGGVGGAVHVWDVGRRAEVALLRGHKDFIRDVVFSRDGAWLASAGETFDRTIRVWDVSSRREAHVLEGHAGGVYALAVSPDGKLLASGSTDGTSRLWDTADWKQVAVLTHGTNVYGVAFTPDGTRLACACANNTIRLWDVATRQAVCDLHGHADYVHQVAFSPDGARLVSASGDSTARVWDGLPGQRRAGPRLSTPPEEKSSGE